MKISKTLLISLSIILVIALIVVIIPMTSRKSANKGDNKILLGLNWYPDASVAPILAAKEEGYFEDEGLDVTINNGGPDINTINLLVSGSDDIVLASNNAQVLQAIDQKTPIKMVGALYRNPIAFVAKKSSGIDSPKDFEGKKVSYYSYSPENIRALNEMVRISGGNPAKVISDPFDFTYKTFTEDKVDVAQLFVSDQLNTIRSHGFDLNIFLAGDYNINSYGGIFIVTEKMYKSNKNIIKSLLKAVNKGITFVQNNPDESANIVIKYNDQSVRESIIGNFSDIKKYGVYDNHLRIDPNVIKESYDYFIKSGDIKNEFDWKNSFSNDLLPLTERK